MFISYLFRVPKRLSALSSGTSCLFRIPKERTFFHHHYIFDARPKGKGAGVGLITLRNTIQNRIFVKKK